MFNNDDISIKLYNKVIIKIKKRLFKITTILNKYIKIFIFKKNCFLVQIEIIKYYKIKIINKSITYTKLATNFLKKRKQIHIRTVYEAY